MIIVSQARRYEDNVELRAAIGRIKYLSRDSLECRKFIVAKMNDKIVGVLAYLTKTFYADNSYGIAYVSVDPDYKNMLVATKLVDFFFNLAVIENVGVVNTAYTDEGELYLSKVIDRAVEKYPTVNFLQRI